MRLENSEKPAWLKNRGYIHITPKIDVPTNHERLYLKVNDENFVANHGFFPLIHSVIQERKFKKGPDGINRGHTHYYKDIDKHKKTVKSRPLHYATHIDALIYGCYADKLSERYEEELLKYKGLNNCVIAYRKLKISDDEDVNNIPGKSTIHFAHEAFEEIKKRAQKDCVVLMFDIKSFFSELNHQKLKKAWCNLIGVEKLNKAHYNVFKSATDFRYILKDELRLYHSKKGRRTGFDERELASVRKNHGMESFFPSIQDFKEAIKNKKIKVYKHPFMKNKCPVGIPQGLPISAVLANLYLLEFDKVILGKVVNQYEGFYRRYSDDIMIICKPEQADDLESLVLDEIKNSDVDISKDKTEKYLFKKINVSKSINRITSFQILKDKPLVIKPLIYLGFEFYGYKTLVKSSNLSKYYRRMIYLVKRKAARAVKISKSFESRPAIFPRQLRKIYNNINLNSEKIKKRPKWLVRNREGFYYYKVSQKITTQRSNYITYVERASSIMNERSIKNQIRNRKRIFREAMAKHLNKPN